jgi:hypothetical protein
MRQTPPQIRLGGYLSLGISLLNILIFGTVSLVEHRASFVLAALPSFVITTALGIYFVTQAERIAASAINPKGATKTPPAVAPAHNAAAFQSAGRIFLATGAGLFVMFIALAFITHIAAFFFAAVAPAIIFMSIGGIYLLTSFPEKKK